MRSFILRSRESFWFLPGVLGLTAIVLAEALVALDRFLLAEGDGQVLFLDVLSASGGRAILEIIGTSMLTVAATSFSITISVLATTSSTYGPRLVRNFLADRANQLVLASFTATFLYALVVLRSVRTVEDGGNDFVPVISTNVAVLLGILNVAVLVFFIHHIADSVQITTLQRRVQTDLTRAVDLIYPADPAASSVQAAVPPVLSPEAVPASTHGYVERVDLAALCEIARAHDCVIDVVAMPGVHRIAGEDLVRVSPGRPAEEMADAVRAAFTLGVARTPHQDVRFAMQQLVEVAVRGLASGSNDPYTAVTALDLAATALVPVLSREPAATGLTDDAGHLRVLLHWPTPEDLIGDVFGGVETYGLDHPLVVRAALGLAERLAAVATTPTVTSVLTDTVRRLESARA
ncbi:DUF2254 domain-containing protein [Cryobacterium sp. PAMC25264]|uniref:DUF2254 domain-containing protein n=1 Tax=Cryobacterium sp. PAMC25264 TaxID=2861288 RepID=UPI001C635411|nr:DUF2254 domain-containing protein [Cryobacterium sp. PAMC25264]QYF73142.1 DUF2254 domain-containing protein [Cryobacterium sp. PAMC25264]